MKKQLSLLLLTALLLTGCGSSQTPETTMHAPETAPSAAVETTQAPETTPAPETTEIPETEEFTVPLSPDAYQVVYSYVLTDDDQEYYSFQGLDPEKNVIWTRETSHTPAAQLPPCSPVGTMDGSFYYCDSGSLIALDVTTGLVRWENTEFGGSLGNPQSALLDPNGYICLCGYFGPDLFIADTEGNTVKKTDHLDPEYFWASRLRQEGNELLISMEGGPQGQGKEFSLPMDWIPQAMG